MVENKLIRNLMYTGLSEYEARAYVALLGASPAGAYEVAKSSGIPTSKVYEVMARLEERGVAAQVERDGKSKYVPQPPEEFLRMRRHMMDTTLGELDTALQESSLSRETATIWNISDYDSLMEKAILMLDGAQSTLLLSLWALEAEELKPMLLSASKRGVKVATIHFGPAELKVGAVYVHPIQHTLFEEKGGRGLVIVADSKEALVGTVRGEVVADGAFSKNEGFVAMAEDYIRHDIYMMKVVSRFDPVLKQRFGPRYEKLRNVFTDEEIQ